MIKNRRIGRFHIGIDIINELQDAVIELMLGLIVLEATTRVYSDSIEYVAISPIFDEVEDCHIVPEYDVVLLPASYQLIFRRRT